MSIAREHLEWLSLVEVSGPFLSIEVLLRAFPNGLPARDSMAAAQLREAYEEWSGTDPNRPWIEYVLKELLGWPSELLVTGQQLPAGLDYTLPEYGETLRPDYALLEPSGRTNAGCPMLLVKAVPAGQRVDKTLHDAAWKASPATRMGELLKAVSVPLGLVTNGEQWMLVHASRGKPTGFVTWQAALWQEEPVTLRAFKALLETRRFFGVADTDTLSPLLEDSSNDQQAVTDQLGRQVREAVEVLVQALDRIDQDTGRRLLAGVTEHTLYEAALTVMMRLVFVFAAEERGLLLLGQPLYDDNYALSTLREHLQELADKVGEEVLERRFDAWAQFLATTRAIYNGITHPDLNLPAYGGSLFDPDRYPLLEGRGPGTSWRDETAEPLKISNRVMLHLLSALQVLQTRLPGGGPAEARRLSFRALDVEQIGHVYEGLLDHTAARATGPMLGLVGTKNLEAEISLATLEEKRAAGEETLVGFLKGETGKSESSLRRLLAEPSLASEHELLVACGQDAGLLARIRPFAGLLRRNSFGQWVVLLPGAIYVAAGTTRRDSSTYYTPRVLAEKIVRHTLEPLVYSGPAEGHPRQQWKLRPPAELLALRVCDPAMGSGAFLVGACRYLSERLVESWAAVQVEHGGIAITPLGEPSRGASDERLLPEDTEERLILARRLVADRNLYGVDINPLAVEMAKLSLWLVTLQKNRPFTFVDHALKCGDSLLGIADRSQLEHFSLRDTETQIPFGALNLWRHTELAEQQRRELEALPSETPQQIASKQQLNAEAERLVFKLKCTADILLAMELKHLTARRYREERDLASERVQHYWTHENEAEFRAYADAQLEGRRTFHWPLEFPEIFAADRGGFDAFMGNPPFKGGQKLTGLFGTDYRNYLVKVLAEGRRGSADLVTYFFLRAATLVRPAGDFGFIAVNTIAEGDTRQVGLEALIAGDRYAIYHADANVPWPNDAAVVVCLVNLRRGAWHGEYRLNDRPVPTISAYLSDTEEWTPERLVANGGKSFQGSIVLGLGFTLSEEEAHQWIAEDPRNAEVLFPYLNGEDLNGDPQQRASRWVINFWDWPEERARTYAKPYQRVLEQVKPERQRRRDDGRFVLRRPLPERWWQYCEKRPGLYHAIGRGHTFENHPRDWDSRLQPMSRVVACSEVTKHLAFVLVRNVPVFTANVDVFADAAPGFFAVLQSTIHEVWARKQSAKLETRLKYSPGNAFETFPFPEGLEPLASIGEQYESARSAFASADALSITGLYNRFHNSNDHEARLDEFRGLHRQMDRAVADAYGWADLDLGHGFHQVSHLPSNDCVRFTLSEAARRDVLSRLSALNRERYAEEQREAAGNHAAVPQRRGSRRRAQTGSVQDSLL